MHTEQIVKIDPRDIDLVMRDEDFVIYYQNKPLLTPNGNEVSYGDARLLRYILTGMTIRRKINFSSVNCLNLFSFMADHFHNGNDPVKEHIKVYIAGDPLVMSKLETGETSRLIRIQDVLEYLDENPQTMNLIFWGGAVITQLLHDFLSGMEQFEKVMKDFQAHREELIAFIEAKYESLSSGQRASVHLLSLNHRNGLLLPMLLILSKVSPTEYANITLALHTNRHRKHLAPAMELFGKHKIPYQKITWNNPEKTIETFYHDAVCVTEFIGFFEQSRKKISVISELIAQGEHDKMEFKSTFRWDIRQNKKNPAIEHAALKTMAAFLNSDGGDLLIGVEDNGNIYGIEADNFPNDDKFLLHVWMLIKSSMGQDVSPYIKTTLERFGDKTVCRVHCLPSPAPVFLRQKGFDESFYIRIGPSTGSLEISEALKYISEHFK